MKCKLESTLREIKGREELKESVQSPADFIRSARLSSSLINQSMGILKIFDKNFDMIRLTIKTSVNFIAMPAQTPSKQIFIKKHKSLTQDILNALVTSINLFFENKKIQLILSHTNVKKIQQEMLKKRIWQYFLKFLYQLPFRESYICGINIGINNQNIMK